MKKTLAVVLTVFIVGWWAVTVCGVGSFAPLQDQIKLGLDLKGGVSVVMEAQTDKTGSDLKSLMQQTQAVIEKRVNEFGLSEPVVTIEGEKRIRVELPGAEDADQAIEQIGKTAQLQFVMADGTVVLDGSQVKNAGVGRNDGNNSGGGGYVVTLEFDKEGAAAFEAATKKIVSGQVTPSQGLSANQIIIMLDDKILSSPAVSEVISSTKCQITGNFTSDEASNLAVLIRGGALPVPLEEVDTMTVGPTLGIDSLKGSIVAGGIGVVLILVFMVCMYNIMGIAADIALMLYVLIVLWVMTAFGAVLTLPGIAGIILGVGMAVDANVIIFSRIREEVQTNSKSIRVATHDGFRRAMSTVVDSQVTTMIAAVVLYQLGSGAVRGFAMTLMISIVASVFTAVVVTQLYLGLMAESKKFGQKKYFGIKEAK